MKLLHQMNPKRVGFIRNHLCKLFNLDPYSPKPLQGLKILDVGCGAGLLAEVRSTEYIDDTSQHY